MATEQHNRLNEKLRDYWNSVCKGRPFPEEKDIEPEALKDIWASCYLVKHMPAESGNQGYRYDYLGADLIAAFGSDVTNTEISSKLIDPTSPPLVMGFDKVASTGKPHEESAEFTNSKGLLIKYRSCMLPLGSGKVNYILGGMKWKSF